ncbi:MAG: HIT family protein [Candidatus Nanohaloarchaea archaeon]
MPQQGMPGQGDQCIYCQLIDNPDQLMLVGETENFYAWLEVQARARGHTQVVPKEHVESLMEFSPEEYHEMMTLVREVIEKAEEGLGADGASVVMNIKEAAGQMIPHAYISVFPRFSEDENAGTPTGAIFQHIEELQDESRLKEIKEEMESVSVSFEQETKEPHPESQRFKEGQKPLQAGKTGSGDTGQEDASGSEEERDRKESDESDEAEIDYGDSYEWV